MRKHLWQRCAWLLAAAVGDMRAYETDVEFQANCEILLVIQVVVYGDGRVDLGRLTVEKIRLIGPTFYGIDCRARQSCIRAGYNIEVGNRPLFRDDRGQEDSASDVLLSCVKRVFRHGLLDNLASKNHARDGRRRRGCGQ